MMQLIESDVALLMCEREKLSGAASPSLRRPYITLWELEKECSTPDLKEVLEYVTDQCIRYALSVGAYIKVLMSGFGIGSEDLNDAEDARKRIHDATIDAINALSRQLKKAGKNNAWIFNLTTQGRPAYGKFATLIAFEAIEQYSQQKEAV